MYMGYGKSYGIIYAPPPDQLVYDDDVAHSGRNNMMGCAQRRDDVMALYTRIYKYIYVYEIWERLWHYIRTTT